MSDNVINIEDFKNKRLEKVLDKIDSDFDEMDESIDQVIIESMSDLVAMYCDIGFEITKEEFVYDVSFVYESLKSLLMKEKGFYHPMQETAAKMYQFIDTDDRQLELDFGEDL